MLDELADRIADRVVEKLKAGAQGQQPRLFTVKQAAVYLGRTEKAVYHLLASGVLPSVRADARIMLDRVDLDRWIQQNKT